MRSFLVIIFAFIFSTGAIAGPSWSKLKRKNADEAYCTKKYSTEKKMNACKAELIAMARAAKVCVQSTKPAYCQLMAESAWDSFKYHLAKGKPTKQLANGYPVFCEFGKKKPTLCADQMFGE